MPRIKRALSDFLDEEMIMDAVSEEIDWEVENIDLNASDLENLMVVLDFHVDISVDEITIGREDSQERKKETKF